MNRRLKADLHAGLDVCGQVQKGRSVNTVTKSRALPISFIRAKTASAVATRNVRNCRFVPDLATQKTIADFLDRETVALDKLRQAVLASIDLLRKYRSALITAAVTGGTGIVDMRGAAATPERSLP